MDHTALVSVLCFAVGAVKHFESVLIFAANGVKTFESVLTFAAGGVMLFASERNLITLASHVPCKISRTFQAAYSTIIVKSIVHCSLYQPTINMHFGSHMG